VPGVAEALPLTVVIPAFDREGPVERALRSIRGQVDAAPAEVIVVDDASSDDTAGVAERAGARVIRHEANQGEGAARNTGLRAASHPWVALLDSDDEWLPSHLATLWPLRENHILASTACFERTEGQADGRVQGWTGSEPLELSSPSQILFPQNLLAPSAALLHRDTALEVGGFAVDMPRLADLDMWVRMVEAGPCVVSPAVTVVWHQHPGQVSTDGRAMRRAHFETIMRYSDRPWSDARLVNRYRGLMAWDDRRDLGLRALRGLIGHPRRLEGLVRALLWRRSVRRATVQRPAAGST
jgi:glycosyltransferase involved in cell wall biosynthesis